MDLTNRVTEFTEAFFNLLMCSDPYPGSAREERIVKAKADKWARELGFENWIAGYHGLIANAVIATDVKEEV